MEPAATTKSAVSVDEATDYAKDHDPLLSYSYLNEKNEVRFAASSLLNYCLLL